MKSASCKAKGRKAVAKLIKMILEVCQELESADIFKPVGTVLGEDLIFSPKARKLLPISVEVKNQESLNIWSALEQCESNAKEYEPVLFFKRNKTKLYAVVDARTLIALYKARSYEI